MKKCFVFGKPFRFREMGKYAAYVTGLIGRKEEDVIFANFKEIKPKLDEQKGYVFIEDLTDKCFWLPEETFDALCNTQKATRCKSFIEIVPEENSFELKQAIEKYKDKTISLLENLIQELKKD